MDELQQQIVSFLDTYRRKDVAGVLALCDPETILVMGTDASEVCTSPQSVQRLLELDFQLWDRAEWGEFHHFFSYRAGEIATTFFDIPFTTRTADQSRITLVRFAMIWRSTSNGWRVVQSLNTVPTVGQGAADILGQSAQEPGS